MTVESSDISVRQGRLVSLDAFRGFTMLLLVSGGFGMRQLFDNTFLSPLAVQFTHHEWNGLYLWDLIQPFFMFIVGVAMPFSFGKRWDRGDTWSATFLHALKRSATLLFFGLLLHCYYSKAYVFELWNVLSQLSVTYLVAFLFMRKHLRTQIIASLVILFVNYILYRTAPFIFDGVTSAWEKGTNLGSYMDMVLMGKINNGGWVAINVIGSSAHTMWGVIAGTILKGSRPQAEKIRLLLVAGIIAIIAGLALDPITPIIKRICTSSFIIVSGGWCLVALALFYWIIDVRGHNRWCTFLVAVGLNPIVIYLTKEFLGGWIRDFISIFTLPFLSHLGRVGHAINQNLVLLVFWYLAWWLWRRRIFIRI